MNSRPRRILALSHHLALCGALLGVSVSVDAVGLRRALVQAVTVASAVDPAVDSNCTSIKFVPANMPVAVVSYRVGKSLYVRSVPIGVEDGFAVHEEVLADPDTCRIAHLPAGPSSP